MRPYSGGRFGRCFLRLLVRAVNDGFELIKPDAIDQRVNIGERALARLREG